MSDDKVSGSMDISPQWVCHHGNPRCVTELMTKNRSLEIHLKNWHFCRSQVTPELHKHKQLFSILLH